MDIVCLLARDAGLSCLEALLKRHGEFKVKALFTHRFLPKSENKTKNERPEFRPYQKAAEENQIPFYAVDSKAVSSKVHDILLDARFDVLLSCSWRYWVSPQILGMARAGSVNLHRGRLPDYKGAEPVRRALEAGDKTITISAHRMVEEIDAGEVLAEKKIKVEIKPGESFGEAAWRIKKEIVPFYPEVMFGGIERLLQRKTDGQTSRK